MKKTSFIERTLTAAITVFRDSVINEETASRSGFLQNLDPRFKILAVLFLLLSVLFARSSIVISGLYLLCLFLCLFSRIGLGFFLKRTLSFIPLFSLFIVIPVLFNFITPGNPVYGKVAHPAGIYMTREGLHTAGFFLLRITACVSFAVLLTLSTRQTVLLKALRCFGVPQIFVMTTGMTFRYLYFLLSLAQNTLLAVKSRIGTGMPAKTGQKITTGAMAGLWIRSYRMHEQVYNAMLSRGYSGEARPYKTFKVSVPDIFVFSISIIIFTGTIWLNQFFH